MRVVLDTNVVISALVYGGKPSQALRLAQDSIIQILTSEPLRAEAERILAEKFGWPPVMIARGCRPIWRISELIEPDFVLTDCPDPDDNRVLECAVAGAADCIVTGDKVLLRMHPFRGIAIIPTDIFLRLNPEL